MVERNKQMNNPARKKYHDLKGYPILEKLWLEISGWWGIHHSKDLIDKKPYLTWSSKNGQISLSILKIKYSGISIWKDYWLRRKIRLLSSWKMHNKRLHNRPEIIAGSVQPWWAVLKRRGARSTPLQGVPPLLPKKRRTMTRTSCIFLIPRMFMQVQMINIEQLSKDNWTGKGQTRKPIKSVPANLHEQNESNIIQQEK